MLVALLVRYDVVRPLLHPLTVVVCSCSNDGITADAYCLPGDPGATAGLCHIRRHLLLLWLLHSRELVLVRLL